MKNPKCVKCKNDMELGITRRHAGMGSVISGSSMDLYWGKNPNNFSGKLKEGFFAHTYRCKKCGYLEFYAADASE